jgi:hypothetical protein
MLIRQVPHCTVPSQRYVRKSNLPQPGVLIAFQDRLESKAAALLREDERTHGGMFRQRTALTCMNAALLAMCFGRTPPVRLTCIRTCRHPDHVEPGGCDDESCRCV